MLFVQTEQKYYANISQIPSSSYFPRDKVWLNAKIIYWARLSQKLDSKNVGPFKVCHALSVEVFELEFLLIMQIHLMFHTNLLSPIRSDPLPSQKLEFRLLIIVANGEYKVYVNSILDSRLNK